MYTTYAQTAARYLPHLVRQKENAVMYFNIARQTCITAVFNYDLQVDLSSLYW